MSSGSPAVRQVWLANRRSYGFGDFQRNYLNYRIRRLIRSTEIYGEDGELYYRVNALGCRGEEIAPGVPVVALTGDSVIHGIEREWLARHVSVAGCQVVNGGIEAMLLPWIVDRTLELRDECDLVCAAVHSGWHNIVYNERDEDFWARELDRLTGIPVVAHFRLVADVNEEAVARGYEAVFARNRDYLEWQGFDWRSEADRRRFADAIDRFNTFIERYCAERGRVLIDLAPVSAPRTHDDLGVTFCDFIHPSIPALAPMGRVVSETLAAPVAAALETRR